MICVVGSINLDLVMRVPRLPRPGETIAGERFDRFAGGKGANQALAVDRAGAPMRFFGAVGSDEFATPALAELAADGVDLSDVARLDGSTGIAVITVETSGENVIAIVAGANGKLDTQMAKACLDAMARGDILLLQQEIPTATLDYLLDGAKSRAITTILNIAPFVTGTRERAQKADIVIANETEFAALTDHEHMDADALLPAARSWSAECGVALILTLGAQGAVAIAPDGTTERALGLKIEPVDTVGAGDTFCGYYAAARDAGLDDAEALSRAAVAGSLACLEPGAQPAIPYADAVDAALKNASR